MDKHWRSILKAVTWRLIGTIDTMVISFIITGKINVALSIGGIEFFSKIALYFFHEKIWDRINLGKEKMHGKITSEFIEDYMKNAEKQNINTK